MFDMCPCGRLREGCDYHDPKLQPVAKIKLLGEERKFPYIGMRILNKRFGTGVVTKIFQKQLSKDKNKDTCLIKYPGDVEVIYTAEFSANSGHAHKWLHAEV